MGGMRSSSDVYIFDALVLVRPNQTTLIQAIAISKVFGNHRNDNIVALNFLSNVTTFLILPDSAYMS